MILVYHPAEWTAAWPKGAKPFLTEELCHAHTGSTNIISSAYVGSMADVEQTAPVPEVTSEEQAFVAENPNVVTDALVPTDPASAPEAAPAAKAPARPEPKQQAKPQKKGK